MQEVYGASQRSRPAEKVCLIIIQAEEMTLMDHFPEICSRCLRRIPKRRSEIWVKANYRTIAAQPFRGVQGGCSGRLLQHEKRAEVDNARPRYLFEDPGRDLQTGVCSVMFPEVERSLSISRYRNERQSRLITPESPQPGHINARAPQLETEEIAKGIAAY